MPWVKYLLTGYFVQTRGATGDQCFKLHRQVLYTPSLNGTLSFAINYVEIKKRNHFIALKVAGKMPMFGSPARNYSEYSLLLCVRANVLAPCRAWVLGNRFLVQTLWTQVELINMFSVLKGQRKTRLFNPRDATHSTKKNETELAVGLSSFQDFLYKKRIYCKRLRVLRFPAISFSGLLISPWVYAFEKEPLNGTKTKIVGVAPIHCTPQEEIIT